MKIVKRSKLLAADRLHATELLALLPTKLQSKVNCLPTAVRHIHTHRHVGSTTGFTTKQSFYFLLEWRKTFCLHLRHSLTGYVERVFLCAVTRYVGTVFYVRSHKNIFSFKRLLNVQLFRLNG